MASEVPGEGSLVGEHRDRKTAGAKEAAEKWSIGDERHTSGAKVAAEKGRFSLRQHRKKQPQGLKPAFLFWHLRHD
jgi:hypothetical protein